MSRNYDGLTTIPYNSTMQDELDEENYSVTENELGIQNLSPNSNHLELELEDQLRLSDCGESEHTVYHEIRTMTPLDIHSRSNNTKRIFKSFQEKYPISMPEMNCFSSSLNTYDDQEDCFLMNGNSLDNPRRKQSSGSKHLGKQDLHKIYQELNVIHNKLVEEYKILQEREDELRYRENKLRTDEERLLKLTQLDAKLRLEEIKQDYDKELDNLRDEFKNKFKDYKRLNESFKTIKLTNENLKVQLQEKHEKNMRLEKQLNALNSRFTNLQKISSVKPNDQPKSATVCGSRNALQIKNTSKTPAQTHIQQHQTLVHNANVLEAFALLLDWIGQVHLKESLNFSLPLSGNNQILDKSCRLLPLLAELIIHLNSSSITNLVANSFQKYHLAFLEFIYWSLLHYDFSTNSAKVNLTATFRRIGEELYKSYNKNYNETGVESDELATIKNNEFIQDEIGTEAPTNVCLFSLFLQSNNPSVRMLSCLIILRTLSQADHISNVFEILRKDLKVDNYKKIFLNYYGTWTIIKWLKLSSKHFLGCSIDTYLQLSTDWEYVEIFLESCSNETWFSHIGVIMKSVNIPNAVKLDINFFEKLSVLLQKLSQIKSNRKYFEMFSLGKICNDLLQRHQYESNFLIMNLKSILFNIGNNVDKKKGIC